MAVRCPLGYQSGCLKEVDCCSYEMRRQCQEIVPNVLLGPFLVSKSLEILKELEITHMFVRHCILQRGDSYRKRQRMYSGQEGGLLSESAISGPVRIHGA
jgi:hypothetical protein